MVLFITICVIVIFGGVEPDPTGHMQRLGSHMPPVEIEVREGMMDPIEFFNEYMKPGKPVIFKGAAKVAPNFELWKDDEYLRKKYGAWFVSVEVGKYEGGIYGTRAEMTFARFLDTYKKKNYYLIQVVAPANPMTQEIPLLKPLSCGGFEEHIQQIMLLFSSGGTDSALHIDGSENFHCTLDGTKDWVFFDRKHRDLIPRMEEHGAYAPVDARSVDMYKYPVMRLLPWYHAFLESGDCLYVPYGWYHHVKSSDSRNMAIAFWINNLRYLTHLETCPANLTDSPNYRSIRNYGFSKFIYARSTMWKIFVDNPDIITKAKFMDTCIQQSGTGAEACHTAYKLMDSNADGYITAEEVLNISEEAVDAEIFQQEPLEYHDIGNIVKDEL